MNISVLIDEFLKQNIQSEAEVRSKLIVPLLELLGYSKDFRAEEFPVYGYEGGKPLKTKVADFLQFTSGEFDKNRGKTDSEKEWVFQHSLLVFEAKKPTEKILVKEQPIFYSAWTKAVAYMISNGLEIEGYIVNANYSDKRVFSCKVKDIPENWETINLLNYERISEFKQEAFELNQTNEKDIYEDYKNVMWVQCTEELCACVDRNLKEFSYDMNIRKDGEQKEYKDILDDSCKMITSEPGGGKSYLMWMLMREYLHLYDMNKKRIPVMLEGRYYGRTYHSIADGIYNELSILPFITVEIVEKRLREGGFVILFDALDEVERDYDILVYDLHKLKRNTDNVLIVTARTQNYKEEFCTEFIHYSLDPLDDERMQKLLDGYLQEEGCIRVQFLPGRLRELIRTPLFLKMFASVVKREGQYKIPSNHAALFEAYVSERMKILSCNLYEETVIKSVLSSYAFYSYENGDCQERFFEILREKCDGLNQSELYKIIWKTGLVVNGRQGIKYYHKAIQEFFVAVEVAGYDKKKLTNWLDTNACNEKYTEVICYLTGVLSNRQKQNDVLDYLEIHNLKLFIKALQSRRNFDGFEMDLTLQYARDYYTQILKTYTNIVETYFYKICHNFDGYNINGTGKVCIRGNMNFTEKSITMTIYSGGPEEENLNITVSENSQENVIFVDGKRLPVYSGISTEGRIHIRCYNLESWAYGFDSSREIAVNIVKSQVKDAIEKKTLFDIELDVLLAERTEKELNKLKRRIYDKNIKKLLSLYAGNISEIIDVVSNLDFYDRDTDRIVTFCKLLENRTSDIQGLLDVKADLVLDSGRTSYRFDELYSDAQLAKKIERIFVLSSQAVHAIITDIVPVFSTVHVPVRKIVAVYRNGECPGVSYVGAGVQEGEDFTPIVEYKENDCEIHPELDPYYVNKLNQIGKNESYILKSCSSMLMKYFGDNVFHEVIYEEIEDLFKRLFK